MVAVAHPKEGGMGLSVRKSRRDGFESRPRALRVLNEHLGRSKSRDGILSDYIRSGPKARIPAGSHMSPQAHMVTTTRTDEIDKPPVP